MTRRSTVLVELTAGPLGAIIGFKRSQLESQSFSPAAFTVDALAKDVRLATESTQRRLGLAEAVLAMTADTARRGRGGEDFSALAATDGPTGLEPGDR